MSSETTKVAGVLIAKCPTCAGGNTKGCLFQDSEHGLGNRVFNKTAKQAKSSGASVWRCTACGELKEA